MFEQVLNLLHDHRKIVDYLTFTNYCAPSTRLKAVTIFKPILLNYLLSKYSCNPIIKDQKLNLLKKQLKDLIQKHPNFGFERGYEVMKYIPLAERPSRSQPPPPPPSLITQLRNRRSTLRRRRRRQPSQQTVDFSESDSDDISDLDVIENVENVLPPSQEMTTITVTPPPPINIVIPPSSVTTETGNLVLTGLPFASPNTTRSNYASSICTIKNWATAYSSGDKTIMVINSANSTSLNLVSGSRSTGLLDHTAISFTGGSCVLSTTLTYRVN